MHLNEHDSKRLFEQAGLPVPDGLAVTTDDIDGFAPPFSTPWFVKAQVLTGGRGKAGGIRRVDAPEDFAATAADILAMDIKGHSVPLVRVEPGTNIDREFYLSLTVSRERRRIVLTLGREGGVEIENLGAENLLVQDIEFPAGLQSHHIRAAFFHLGLTKSLFPQFSELLVRLFGAVSDRNLLLAEINPLVLTGEGSLICLDGKVEIDDNAADIDATLQDFYRPEHRAQEENVARDAGLSFVKLDGFVGLMVNGAGLAMATMDLLNYSDLPAANFLDLGGGADQTRMETAFGLLFGDDRVEMLFINLYGGILSCEKVARAMEAALGGKAPKKPIVARLSGNQAQEGLACLRGLNVDNLYLASEMGEAIDILTGLRSKSAPNSIFTAPETPAPCSRPAARFRPGPVFDIDENTSILVQGLTGKEGSLHAELMLAYGADVVCGVTPFKGGLEVLGKPVYSSIAEACRHHEIGASIIFVPASMAADAVLEAAANNIPWCVCITEGIPQQDMLAALSQMRDTPTRLLGPNTPGLIVPGKTKIGILPTDPFTPGPVAVLSRSGTLTYEVAARMSAAGLGQSVCVGVGGDPFVGQSFTDMFELLRNHEETKAVVVLGEIGGRAEEDLARYVTESGFDKPVVSFIAGRTAPPGKRLGHAGAILEKGGTIEDKIETMRKAGFRVCASLDDIAGAVEDALKS